MPDPTDELRALQLRFQAYIEGTSEDFIDDIISTAEARAEHRLAAYYNAYRLRLINCLANDYAVLRQTLGEETFEYLVLDYLRQYPSSHPSVRWVGQYLARFIRTSAQANREFLAELAEFEWAQGLSFDAAEHEPSVTLADMAKIEPTAWPGIRINFQPHVRWLDLHCNAPPYWTAIDNDETAPQPECFDVPTRWLMWRRDLQPNWRSLEAAEAWAVEAVMQGVSFAELCGGLLEWIGEDDVAMTAAGYLKQWIHDDMVSTVTT